MLEWSGALRLWILLILEKGCLKLYFVWVPYDIPNDLSNATTNQMKQLKKKHDRKLIFD